MSTCLCSCKPVWHGKSNFSFHSGSSERIIIGGGLLWSLFIRESVSDRECHACFINTIPPYLSEESKKQGKAWSDSHASTEVPTHTERGKAKRDQLSPLKSVDTNRGNTNMVRKKKEKKKRLMSESPARSGKHLLGDTLLLAGQGCCVSEPRYHSHRGQRQPSCGVHSALETTSGSVCLEMRMWGSIETPSTQNRGRVYLHDWHLLEFTLSFFPAAALALYACIQFLSFQFGMGSLQRSKGAVGFLQQANSDFPPWDLVSVFSKFYNDKDKAITKVTLNFNK